MKRSQSWLPGCLRHLQPQLRRLILLKMQMNAEAITRMFRWSTFIGKNQLVFLMPPLHRLWVMFQLNRPHQSPSQPPRVRSQWLQRIGRSEGHQKSATKMLWGTLHKLSSSLWDQMIWNINHRTSGFFTFIQLVFVPPLAPGDHTSWSTSTEGPCWKQGARPWPWSWKGMSSLQSFRGWPWRSWFKRLKGCWCWGGCPRGCHHSNHWGTYPQTQGKEPAEPWCCSGIESHHQEQAEEGHRQDWDQEEGDQSQQEDQSMQWA